MRKITEKDIEKWSVNPDSQSKLLDKSNKRIQAIRGILEDSFTIEASKKTLKLLLNELSLKKS